MSVIDVCGEDDFDIGERRRVELEGVALCVARCREGYHIVADVCSHEDFPLSEGEVDLDECLIECWKHGSMFSLVTGQPMSFPATQPVRVYEVVAEGGRIGVKLG